MERVSRQSERTSEENCVATAMSPSVMLGRKGTSIWELPDSFRNSQSVRTTFCKKAEMSNWTVPDLTVSMTSCWQALESYHEKILCRDSDRVGESIVIFILHKLVRVACPHPCLQDQLGSSAIVAIMPAQMLKMLTALDLVRMLKTFNGRKKKLNINQIPMAALALHDTTLPDNNFRVSPAKIFYRKIY
ncbi:hypothetical protein MAR_011907 [Mya arenaria]|uniref:Uncharacterized protein n=1 Tax=Mya arenaria TaxID=6604 RepID=A0ABY7FVH9_MYAAR|nr:hypothetical protein MAR_011907 [Mya arenaria]